MSLGPVAVAYLLSSGCRRYRGGTPWFSEVVLAGLGAIVPVLLDRPLAWTIGVLESGHSVSHSWLVAGVVLLLLWGFVALPRRPTAGRGRLRRIPLPRAR